MSAKFFVHIVESPSPEEMLDGVTEGRALCSFLDIARIAYTYNLAIDEQRFREATTGRFVQACQFWRAWPILHLSVHGSDQGIQLCQQRHMGEFVPWKTLGALIKPIHQAMGSIGVCMSSCCGAHGRQMAQVIRPEDVPFLWIVGTHTKIDLRDAAIAFAVFYRGFQRGDRTDQQLIEAMRAASGVTDFDFEFGNSTQQQYTYRLFEQWIQKQPKTQGPSFSDGYKLPNPLLSNLIRPPQ